MMEELVSRYTLLNLIGEGKTSLIYRAEDSQLKRTVALKCARVELIQEKPLEYHAIFAREAQFLFQLEHAHILPIYDFGLWGQTPYLASRFVPNRDLGQIVAQGAKLSPEKVVAVARQMGLALDFCRSRGIAHRDIKPDNILVDAEGHTYLADFGLACELASDEYKQGAGEYRFVAPEQLPHTPYYGRGQSCDQFSLGVTLYLLLTGRLPLPPAEESSYNILEPALRDQMLQCTAFRAWCGEQIMPASDWCDAPSTVDDVFYRMLALAPDQRFPTLLEAAEQLQRAFSGAIGQTVSGTVFVSYSSADQVYMKDLVSEMTRRGLEIWWDGLIPIGSNWDKEIEKALGGCEAMLVVLTKNSVDSTNVNDEWSFWLDTKKPIVTLVLKDCQIPFRLHRRQHVFAKDNPLEVVAKVLVGALRDLLPPPAAARAVTTPDLSLKESLEQRRYFFNPRERTISAAPAQWLSALGDTARYTPSSKSLAAVEAELAKFLKPTASIIGVDLGATTSVVAIPESRNDEGFLSLPECPNASIVLDRIKRHVTPSVVAENNLGQIVVGYTAKGYAGMSPEPIIFSKRWMGEEKSFQLAKQCTLTPRDAVAHVLRYLKEVAELRLKEPVEEAVITIPAYFSLMARQMTEEAAVMAGLRVVQLAPEPVAAALVHFHNDRRNPLRIMTYDFGGETFDVTILEKRNGAISANSILAFNGDRFLGGHSFDRKLSVWLLEQLKAQGYELSLEPDDPGNRLIFAKLMVYAERAKIALSAQESYEIEDPETGITDQAGNPIAIYLNLTRAQFEGLINEEIERTIHLARQALETAKQVAPEGSRAEEEQFELDEIVLVGGSSRIPCIAQRLEQAFNLVPKSIAPDLCVALGAALIARDRPKAGE